MIGTTITVSGEWPNEKSPGYPPLVKLLFSPKDGAGETTVKIPHEDAILLWQALGKVTGHYRFPHQGMVLEAENMGISFFELCRRIANNSSNRDGDKQ